MYIDKTKPIVALFFFEAKHLMIELDVYLQVVIEKSKPKNIHTQSIPSGCIVESEDEEESSAATSLNSKSLYKQ